MQSLVISEALVDSFDFVIFFCRSAFPTTTMLGFGILDPLSADLGVRPQASNAEQVGVNFQEHLTLPRTCATQANTRVSVFLKQRLLADGTR